MLPGLRGFSATNIKNMRSFYEEWSPIINRQPIADENKSLTAVSEIDIQLLSPCESPKKEDFNVASFLGLGFTHHMIIVRKTYFL